MTEADWGISCKREFFVLITAPLPRQNVHSDLCQIPNKSQAHGAWRVRLSPQNSRGKRSKSDEEKGGEGGM